MFKAEFLFQDGGTLTVDVAPDQTVLEAVMQADAPVRHDCCAGTCGTCIAEHLDGGAVLDAGTMALPLTAEERAAGLMPTCLARLTGDARFRVPYRLDPPAPEPARHAAHVVSVTAASPTVHRLLLELASPEDFSFQPGQYLRVRPPGLKAVRAYSIASRPADLPLVELLIRHVPGGQMSQWLRDGAQAGDRVALHGPLGSFAFDDRAAAHLFIAGGTGLAPVLSMIRTMGPGVPALLCFGCSRPEDLFYLDELRDLAAVRPGLSVRVALFDPAGGALPDGVVQGTALSVLSAADLVPGMTAYLCGPPGMVGAAGRFLAAGGLAPSAIRAERFLPS
ncbi:FAD-binding oxidoreductase [Niveispirillum fermenti]|uniref:FAD-binding oxidoreductase n=1 Tax=Niveispirillum fermenti TaxID=1233113 RepID=UPI003A8C7E96